MRHAVRIRIPSGTARDLAAIVLGGALLLFPALPATDLFNPDEPREAEIAREMSESGDLVVPLFNGCPFLEKPPLFYWTVLLAARVPGLRPETAARLPSALAAIGLLVIVYFMGRELFDRRTGRAAAFVLLTTFQFWWLAKRSLLDMTLAFFVGGAMVCFVMGYGQPHLRYRWFPLAGAACAGAVMTKGLIGLLIPAVTVTVYLWWRRELRLLLSPALLAGAAIPILTLGIWVGQLAARPDGSCYVREFLVENHIKRFMGGGKGGHERPLWYYLQALAEDFQPWVLFLPAALAGLWPGLRRAKSECESAGQGRGPASNERSAGDLVRARGGGAAREGNAWIGLSGVTERGASRDAFLHAWLLPALVILTASSSKRSLYLLPIAPSIALLIAAWWRGRPHRERDRPAGSRGIRSRIALMIPAALLLALGILVALALPPAIAALSTGRPIGGAKDLIGALSADGSGIPAGAAFLTAVLAVALMARRNTRRGASAIVAVVWVLFLVVGAGVLPLANSRLSARSLGETIGFERERGARVAAYRLAEGSLGQFLFYSRGTVDWIGREGGGPGRSCTDCRGSASAEEFLMGPGRRACLLLRGDFERLPLELKSGKVLARGRVGGADYLLLASPLKKPGSAPPNQP